ncbi:MAG: Fic family protein [Lewinella sp.]|nr:Fic family protein [Lewinella sp.]
MFEPGALPEIIFGSPDSAISRQIRKLREERLIRKIAPRLYTSNLKDDPAEIIRRNLFYILGKLYPGSLLSHRSALENRPTNKGNIYLTYTYTKNIQLPGVVLKFQKGPDPIDGDRILNGELYLPSVERGILENLQASRKGSDGELRIVDRSILEKRLIDIFRADGEAGLNAFRDRARKIASILKMDNEFEQLNQMIGALLSTKPIDLLHSPAAVAEALGAPYDAHRMELIWELFAALNEQTFSSRSETTATSEAYVNFSFFEAYFSNYIEGTEFEVEEAREIIFEGIFIENRSGDTHDIKGTYEIVGNRFEMRRTPTSFEQLLELLRARHSVIMRGRPDKNPGSFKTRANRAGNTTFVEPALVRGTLMQAFEPYQALKHPLAKAIFMMFLISEVHPFEDGNGRIARVMMNSELVKEELQKIIIPTVYREDYLLALRKLSRKKDPGAYIRMLDRAQDFSASVNMESFPEMLEYFQRSEAFLDQQEGKLKW